MGAAGHATRYHAVLVKHALDEKTAASLRGQRYRATPAEARAARGQSRRNSHRNGGGRSGRGNSPWPGMSLAIVAVGCVSPHRPLAYLTRRGICSLGRAGGVPGDACLRRGRAGVRSCAKCRVAGGRFSDRMLSCGGYGLHLLDHQPEEEREERLRAADALRQAVCLPGQAPIGRYRSTHP